MPGGRGPTRWIVLVFVLLGAAWGLYRLFDRLADLGPEMAANQLVLPALSMLLVVLFLALAGVLIRNLVRLIVDRKRGILGARLRTKLVFFFLALVLVPALVLFSGSATVIKQTVEAILRTPLEELTQQSDEVVREYFEDQSLSKARGIGDEITDLALMAPGRQADLERLLDRWQREHDLDLIQVTRDGNIVARARLGNGAAAPSGDELQRNVDDLIADVLRSGESAGRINYLSEGLMAHAAVPLVAPADGSQPIVAVGFVLPSRLAANLEGFHGAAQAYRQFRANRKDLVRYYLTQIALILLVTVFLATWLGFYLARRITEPIQEMAAAAREISAGNLNVRVKAKVGDEVGMLVEAFNEMAGELEESRSVITRSTADLRQSNRALNERRRYIETLLANLTTAVVSMDPLGRVTTANPATEAILGVDLRVSDDACQVFRRAGLRPLVDLLEQAPEDEDQRRDLTLDHKGGPLHVAVQVSPLRGAAGENVGTLLMVEDLTDLLQAQRASAWREVAQRIAHEIKNPLTPIQLAAQRLRKKFTEGSADLDRVVPEATATIEREVAGLKQLVDEFSRFARMPEVTPRPVDFREVIDSILALYDGLSEIDWELDLDPRIREVVLDPQQMRRALINLIDNAVAALGGHGVITLSARPVTDELLRIEVADSGPGIPPADRDKMFVPYFSTKKSGTGLGLAIVHRVITDHRGTIRIEDNEPHGARFVIEIPA